MNSEKLIKLIDRIFSKFLLNILSILTKSKKEYLYLNIGEIRSVLIIRPGGLGDAILLVPLIKVLNTNNINVSILCMKRNQVLFRHLKSNGIIKNIYLFEDLKGVFKLLFKENYDVIFDTEQWYYTSAIVAKFIKHKYIVGFDSNERRNIYDYFIQYTQSKYEAQSFLDLLKPFKLELSYNNIGFDLGTKYQFNNLFSKNLKYAVIFNGGSISYRRISFEDVASLINHLERDFDKIVVIGGKKEAIEKENYLKLSEKLIFKAGELDFLETLSVINFSKVFISTDSGPLHFGLLTEVKKIVAIFGPGIDYKWGEKNRMKIYKKGLICQPCNYGRFSQTPNCPYDYKCLNNIDINFLYTLINES